MKNRAAAIRLSLGILALTVGAAHAAAPVINFMRMVSR
jgi:hypothetical protein